MQQESATVEKLYNLAISFTVSLLALITQRIKANICQGWGWDGVCVCVCCVYKWRFSSGSAAGQFKFSHLAPDVIHMAEIPNPFTLEITVATDCQIHTSVVSLLQVVASVRQLSKIHFLH